MKWPADSEEEPDAGLPLALEQADAYVQATWVGMVRYLQLLRDWQGDLLDRGEVDGHPLDLSELSSERGSSRVGAGRGGSCRGGGPC